MPHNNTSKKTKATYSPFRITPIKASLLALSLMAFAFLLPQIGSLSPQLSLSDASEPQSVHRFWSQNFKHHFYTISEEEKNALIQHDKNWNYEGVAYDAYSTEKENTQPIYRFWSENYKGHFFTTSTEEKEFVQANDSNWSYEGIAYHIGKKTDTSKPVHRFYSAAFKGHFYTTSETEKARLIATDTNWEYEGIAFYTEKTGTDKPAPPVVDPEEPDTLLEITSHGTKDLTQKVITVVWDATVAATATISYGTTPGNYTIQSQTTQNKYLTLTELTPDTTYYYKLQLTDAQGNKTLSDERTFHTKKDTSPPNTFTVTAHTITDITNTSAGITFTATEVAQAYTEYGTTTSYGQQTSTETSFNYATHIQGFSGLNLGTKYYYRINVTNQAGQTATETGSFTTTGSSGPICGDDKKEGDEQCDDGNIVSGDGCSSECKKEVVTGPTISSHAAESLTETSAKLRFSASENVQAYVEYGTTINYGQRTPGEDSFTYATHLQDLTGLSSDTLYYYKIHITNQEGEKATATGTVTTIGGDTPPTDPVCGNGGPPEEGEQCDDGNLVNGDGCSDECKIETPPPNTFAVTAHTITDITNTSAGITFTATEVAQAYTEYGTTTSYGQQTSTETSFNYATHIQGFSGLNLGTKYYYRIHATNQAGDKATATGSFTTTGTPPPVTQCNDGIDNDGDTRIDLADWDCTDSLDNNESGNAPQPTDKWPKGANQNLPMGGVFYGMPGGGIYGAGNAGIGRQQSIRFRAEKTGFIDAVSYENRFLEAGDLTARCNNNNAYCKCTAAGLNANQCAYTLGNSYHVGNGGILWVEIYEDDGTSAHRPNESKLLGKMSKTYIPTRDYKDLTHPLHKLDAPVAVTAGKLYHIVIRNKTTPPAYFRQSISAARSFNPNVGAFSMNGRVYPKVPNNDRTRQYGPFSGEFGEGTLYDRGSGWTWTEHTKGWWEVRYTSGKWIGDRWFAHKGLGGHNTRRIDGSRKVRQVFTVKDATRRVTGAWLNYGHAIKTSISGQPLIAQLKNSSGNVLATASFPADPAISAYNRDGSDRWKQNSRAWKYASFGKTITLSQNQTYNVEFSTKAGGNFAVHALIAKGEARSDNIWGDAKAEASTNGGGSWAPFATGLNQENSDVPILFTLEGMPKSFFKEDWSF